MIDQNSFGCVPTFVIVLAWNSFSAWPKPWWGTYYYVTSLIIPIIVFCFMFSTELVTEAFQRGAFDAAATAVTAVTASVM